jgi:hypothetical protein
MRRDIRSHLLLMGACVCSPFIDGNVQEAFARAVRRVRGARRLEVDILAVAEAVEALRPKVRETRGREGVDTSN